jgi:hypothetical protein
VYGGMVNSCRFCVCSMFFPIYEQSKETLGEALNKNFSVKNVSMGWTSN